MADKWEFIERLRGVEKLEVRDRYIVVESLLHAIDRELGQGKREQDVKRAVRQVIRYLADQVRALPGGLWQDGEQWYG